jgi:hypothetical protein
MRHTFRNECTEANFGARIRNSDNVSGLLPTSTVVLPNCVHRPVHQVGISTVAKTFPPALVRLRWLTRRSAVDGVRVTNSHLALENVRRTSGAST